jgi:hypothetical protein
MGMLTTVGTNAYGVLVTDGASTWSYTNAPTLNLAHCSGANVILTNPVVYCFSKTNILWIGTNASGINYTNFWVAETGANLYSLWELDNVGYTKQYTIGTDGSIIHSQPESFAGGLSGSYGTFTGGNVSASRFIPSTSVQSPVYSGANSGLNDFTIGLSSTTNITFLATNSYFSGLLVATNGVSTLVTNTLVFTTVSAQTNTLGFDATASLSAGTSVILQDRNGNTVDTIGTIATLHTLIPMRANMRLSGTAITGVIY